MAKEKGEYIVWRDPNDENVAFGYHDMCQFNTWCTCPLCIDNDPEVTGRFCDFCGSTHGSLNRMSAASAGFIVTSLF